MHRASGRAIGRALLCRRIIICAPVRCCKGSRRHPPHGTYTWPRLRAPATSVWIFFSLARRSPLENGATPEFRSNLRPSFALLFLLGAIAARDRSETISQARLDLGDLLSPDFRLPFRCATRMAGSMRAATSVTAAVTTPGHSKPSWANDTSRSDEFEGRRTGAAIRLRISGLKTPTLFPTSSRLLVIDVAAILPCANTFTIENECRWLFFQFMTLSCVSMKLNVV